MMHYDARFCSVLFQVLFRVALALLRFMEPALLSAHGVAAVYDMLRSPALEDDLVENMYGFWLQGFSTDILSQLRDQHLVFVTSQEPWISHMISHDFTHLLVKIKIR